MTQHYEQQIFQIGSRFPEISMEAIFLNGKQRMFRLEVESAKTKIENLLKQSKEYYVSDLSDLLGIRPSIIIKAVKELKEEGRIKEGD